MEVFLLSPPSQPILLPKQLPVAAASSRRISSTNLCFFRSLLLNPVDQSQLASHGDRTCCGRPNSRVCCLHGESVRPRNGDGDGGIDLKEAGSSEEIDAASAVMVDAFTRRFVVGTGASLLVALGGNLGGVTSFLLGINPGLAQRLRLDFLYPVDHFLRYFDSEKGFEFIYPESWVIDQRLLLRAIQKAESVRSLDLPAVQKNPRVSRLPTEPIVALGPPGTNGELNVSVIVAPTAPGFS
ncbi:hypothetical protein O6H91_Y078400 [Diphasiastrum complanatum]|nr:hypothetical protein O6H91_Y340400 [Diphasiastrum complanatum]KAJ7297137.1 hypothetical protein O6H91_Y078400 [Diphasiastrum complanatum]